nr:hypothetical protein [Tanacetum cinerariifolium]
SVKSVEDIYVTCGGAHPYYQCLVADGNTFLELRDNIQGYVPAAAVNYNQVNFGYRPRVKSSDANSSSSSEIAKLTHAVNQQTSDVTTAMTAILKQFQATPHPAFVKASPPHLGKTFLRTARALIDIHGEEMILRDGNDDLPFDIESNLEEIEYLLDNDLIKEMDSILEDSIDEDNLADLNDNLVDTMPEMFTDEHALDYSSPSLYDEYDNDLFEVESETEYIYDDPFDSNGEKIKEPKLLIDELNLPRSSDFLPSSKAIRLSKSLKFLKTQWRFFLAFVKRIFASWMFLISTSIPHERINSRIRLALLFLMFCGFVCPGILGF